MDIQQVKRFLCWAGAVFIITVLILSVSKFTNYFMDMLEQPELVPIPAHGPGTPEEKARLLKIRIERFRRKFMYPAQCSPGLFPVHIPGAGILCMNNVEAPDDPHHVYPYYIYPEGVDPTPTFFLEECKEGDVAMWMDGVIICWPDDQLEKPENEP